MTPTELATASKQLADSFAVLGDSLRHRDEISIENAPDALDQVQFMGERELAIRSLDRDTRMVRQIKRAQARISDGSYGICLHCEGDISLKRLNAAPWAILCIKCQDQSDRHEIEVADTADLDG